MERLGHAIRRSVMGGKWKPIALSKGGPPLSHLFFANDLVLFGEVTQVIAKVLRSTIDVFCLHSRHKVSPSKSKLCFSTNIDDLVRRKIMTVLSFQ